MGVLRIRAGATIQNPAPAGLRILSALDQWALMADQDVVITSGDEGSDWRAPTDPHQTGEAYDVSLKGFDPEQLVTAYRFLAKTLGARFTVLFEVPPAIISTLPQALIDIAWVNTKATGMHFHLQRKRGTTFP